MNCLAFFLVILTGGAHAESTTDRTVINELRKLRAELPARDPSRPELSLRLADRLADESFLGKNKDDTADRDRKEAIVLYQEVLPSQNGPEKVKIQFQLGRLYAEKSEDSGAQASAKSYFKMTAEQSMIKEIKRESVLRLAEIAESNASTRSEAIQYYKQVLALCEGTDTCAYAHYRMAWIDRNSDRLGAAVDEVKQALWDSKGQIREEALRDMITFMGLGSTQIDEDLSYVDHLATKLGRPQLIEDLAYSYFSSGNKAGGVKVLALTHSRHPTLDSEVRLLEEYYGLRDWDSFRLLLSQFETDVQKKTSVPAKDESEKICRRLATELDGERTSDASHYIDFKQFTLSYLALYPTTDDRSKIMEGLVSAEPKPEVKISLLKTFLSDPKFHLKPSDLLSLHELRAAVAQKEALTHPEFNAIVIEEVNSLAAMNDPTNKKQREYAYVAARAQYTMKNFAVALPEFEKLAKVDKGIDPDSFAIQSQHLILDIYNQQKDYAKMVSSAKTWTENSDLNKNQKIAKDLGEMKQIEEEAQFQLAVSQGNSPDALKVFLTNCKSNKFVPQSCDNAKTMAIHLKAYASLLEVMEIQSKNPSQKDELAAEYENEAYYQKAADILSKNSHSLAFKDQLRIALLFELGQDLKKRNEVLTQIAQQVSTKKLSLNEAEEKIFFSSLKDASLLNAKQLHLINSASLKLYYAEFLEEQNMGTPETKSLLLGQMAQQGPMWSKYITTKAQDLAESCNKISFYGKNAKTAFQKRVNLLNQLNQYADKYLSGGCDSTTQVTLLTILKNSYDQISTEIMGSPMPAQLNEAQVAQIKASLSEMAKPFQDKSDSLATLLKTKSDAKIVVNQVPASDHPAEQKMSDSVAYQEAVKQLHENPHNAAALKQLKQIFSDSHQGRLSAYYEGRIEALAHDGGSSNL